MTDQELKIFSPHTPDSLIPVVVRWFNEYADKYEINTSIRIAAFLAQLIHESNSFKTTREYASGSAYEGRKDLGNIFPGDGKRFKGRGYIQITGRNNYSDVSIFIFSDRRLLENPDLLATPHYAMLSAFWFWHSRNLNALADINYLKTITRRINGGLNGWEDRLRNYNRICDYYHLPHWSE
jgi:putative chitinase